jgi:hypothetical protein
MNLEARKPGKTAMMRCPYDLRTLNATLLLLLVSWIPDSSLALAIASDLTLTRANSG